MELIDAMYTITEAAQPITGRGVGYKLFTANLIASMAKPEMQRVYRLLREAREREIIPSPTAASYGHSYGHRFAPPEQAHDRSRADPRAPGAEITVADAGDGAGGNA
jgi:hypothetical protein